MASPKWASPRRATCRPNGAASMITISTIPSRRRELGGAPRLKSCFGYRERVPDSDQRGDDEGCGYDDVIVTMFGMEGSVHCDNVIVSISIRMPSLLNKSRLRSTVLVSNASFLSFPFLAFDPLCSCP